jgi:hypothetical protein
MFFEYQSFHLKSGHNTIVTQEMEVRRANNRQGRQMKENLRVKFVYGYTTLNVLDLI